MYMCKCACETKTASSSYPESPKLSYLLPSTGTTHLLLSRSRFIPKKKGHCHSHHVNVDMFVPKIGGNCAIQWSNLFQKKGLW